MIHTKRHSQNAVAAKARRRVARFNEPLQPEQARRVPRPRGAADFIISIRCATGERVQMSLTRWGRQFITGDGVKSARQIGRGIELLIRHLAATDKLENEK